MFDISSPPVKKSTSENTTFGNENAYYDPETGVSPYSLSSTDLFDVHSNTAPSDITTTPSNTIKLGLPYEMSKTPLNTSSNNSVLSKTITLFGITLTYAQVLIILVIIIFIAYIFLRGK